MAVGNERLAASLGVKDTDIASIVEKLGSGGTLAFIIVGGHIAGGVRFADAARPEAKDAIIDLRRRGLRTAMLTGDNETAAKAVGEAVGIDDIKARLRPEEKVAALKALASETDAGVAFVGDGVNDGPALATAKLGIALSSGTDVAREAAPITLMRPDLRLVPAALDIAGKTRRTIRQNLGWAFIYNLIGIPLAATGLAVADVCWGGNGILLRLGGRQLAAAGALEAASVLSMEIIRIDDPADLRVAPYLSIRERDLAGRQGRFIAEGKVVLNVLFSAARFEAESVLVLESRLPGLADTLSQAPTSMPVFVASQTVMDAVAGFHIHRGILAIGRKRDADEPQALIASLPNRCPRRGARRPLQPR